MTSASYDTTCSNPITCNKPNSITDARGNVTNFTYDATHGGVLTVTAPAATGGGTRPQTRYNYASLYAYYKNSAGTIVAAPTPIYKMTGVSTCTSGSSCAGSASEIKTTIAYGTPGVANNLLPTSVTSGSGDGALTATTAATYDGFGNPLTVDGPLAGTADTSTFVYDAARQLTMTIGPDPDGGGALKNRAFKTTYNLDGQPTLVEQGTANANGTSFVSLQQAAITYDTLGRKVKGAITSGGTTYAVTQYSYDAANRLDCAAQRMNPAVFGSLPAVCTLGTTGSFGEDRISKNGYDAADEVTSVITGYGSASQRTYQTLTYSGNGKLATLADGNNNLTTYEYDGFDRLAKTRYPSPTTSGVSSTTDYELPGYDPNGNVTSRRLRDGQSIAYTYDNLNRLTAKDRPNGSWWDTDYTYNYDLLGRMTSAVHGNGYGLTYSFGYDALGRKTSETNSWYGYGNMAYVYDLAGRRTRTTWGDGFYADYDRLVTGEVSAVRENGSTSGVGVLGAYIYDDLGRLTTLTRGNGVVTSYGFDAASRLTSLAHDLAGTANDVTTTFSFTPAGQIASSTRSNDTYAWTGYYNVDRPYTINGLNQMSVAGSVSLGYDGRGNLTSSGSNTYGYTSENELTASAGAGYAWNPFGRLFAETINGGTNTTFQYDGAQITTESNASTGGLNRRYVYGPGTDDPLVWYEGSGTTDRRWLIPDERGSVVAVTNASGAATSINRYDEYGIPASTNVGRFGYTGQTWLPELGMWNYKARLYSATLGRFMQTDPIGYGDGPNWYNYVGSDPINATDPSGLYDNTESDTITVTAIRQIFQLPDLGTLNLSDFFARLNSQPGFILGAGAAAAAAAPPAPPQKPKTPCEQAIEEPGTVETVTFNYTAIVGGGITGGHGTFRNTKTGTTGNFFTLGGGAGVDIGVSVTYGQVRSVADLTGFAATLSGTIGPVTGSASFNTSGLAPVGGAGGVAPPSKGGSGTLTGTKLYGCKLGG